MVGELMSIVNAPMIALIATSAKTRSLLIQCTGCAKIVLSPDRPNDRLCRGGTGLATQEYNVTG